MFQSGCVAQVAWLDRIDRLCDSSVYLAPKLKVNRAVRVHRRNANRPKIRRRLLRPPTGGGQQHYCCNNKISESVIYCSSFRDEARHGRPISSLSATIDHNALYVMYLTLSAVSRVQISAAIGQEGHDHPPRRHHQPGRRFHCPGFHRDFVHFARHPRRLERP